MDDYLANGLDRPLLVLRQAATDRRPTPAVEAAEQYGASMWGGQPGSFASRKPGILDGTNWAARYRRADGIAAVETREGPEHSAPPDFIPGCQPAAGVVSIRLGVSCASSIYIY